MPEVSPVNALLEAATIPLTRPQLNTEVGLEARRMQQVRAMPLAFCTWDRNSLPVLLPSSMISALPWGWVARAMSAAQKMDVDGLLASTSRVEQGGVRTLSERGELCYDIPALCSTLQRRHAPSQPFNKTLKPQLFG